MEKYLLPFILFMTGLLFILVGIFEFVIAKLTVDPIASFILIGFGLCLFSGLIAIIVSIISRHISD